MSQQTVNAGVFIRTCTGTFHGVAKIPISNICQFMFDGVCPQPARSVRANIDYVPLSRLLEFRRGQKNISLANNLS